MSGIKRCKKCSKKILPDEPMTILKDTLGHETLRSDYWHKHCFTEWFNKSLEIRAKELYTKSINESLKRLGINVNQIFNNENSIHEIRSGEQI